MYSDFSVVVSVVDVVVIVVLLFFPSKPLLLWYRVLEFVCAVNRVEFSAMHWTVST